MGKYHVPATLFALGLSLANPEAISAQEIASDDEKSSRPLPSVEVRDRREAPDQERLDQKDLARHRGTGNADVFSAVNGVMINNVRNEAGAIDVGIRGLQGEGRVPVIIDGALQSTHTHRGYQGESDRTYIDMDLVREVSVTKGSSFGGAGVGAIGGVVTMRTLQADDVVLPGRSIGILLRGSLYNNNRTPDIPGTARGQQYYIIGQGQSQDRINNGAGSIALAGKHQGFDWLAAYSHRRDGNYFAGRYGIERYGDEAVVRPGQEVVNTSTRSQSSLLKFGLDMRDAQRLEFVWRHHEQRAGEVLAAYWLKPKKDGRIERGRMLPWPAGVEAMPQWALGSTRLDSQSLAYSYTPPGNKLIDLKLGVWNTDVAMEQNNGLFSGPVGAQFGDQYRHRFGDARQGINLSNRALMLGGLFGLELGLNGEEQRTQPLDYVQFHSWSRPSARDARRTAYSTWLNGELNSARVAVRLGARLHGAAVTDYIEQRRSSYRARTDLLGELQVPLVGGVELVGKAARTFRHPSLFESSASQQVFSYDYTYPLRPEQSDSWSLGLQGKWTGWLVPRSTLSARGGYFRNSVKNYIAAAQLPRPDIGRYDTSFTFTNYERLDMSGWELKVGVDVPFFFAEMAGTMYDQPRVCSSQQARLRSEPIPDCNDVGFDWSVVSTRIPPRRSFNLKAGVRLFDARLELGGRLNYHSYKRNPGGWLNGTGATAVVEVPSERIVDLFASLRLDRHVDLELNVDNLQNRYSYDPGTIIGKPRPGRTVRLTLNGRF